MTSTGESSNTQINKVMTHRWLVHSLRTWLDAQGQPRTSYTPEDIYETARDTIDQADADDTMDTMLKSAKRIWATTRTSTEWETLGAQFREWLNQQGQGPQEHPRLTTALASIFQDVRMAIPDAPIDDKLEALKGLWTAHRDRLLDQPGINSVTGLHPASKPAGH